MEIRCQMMGERSQTSDISGEHYALCIPPIVVKFSNTNVQVRAKGWDQVDLSMEEIIIQMLYQLKLNITKDLSQRDHALETNF